MQVAPVTSQCQIIGMIRAAVFLRRDVLNVMLQATMFLVQAAIFAAFASPLPDEVPRRRIHVLLDLRVKV